MPNAEEREGEYEQEYEYHFIEYEYEYEYEYEFAVNLGGVQREVSGKLPFFSLMRVSDGRCVAV
jgi:hypothetical protein